MPLLQSFRWHSRRGQTSLATVRISVTNSRRRPDWSSEYSPQTVSPEDSSLLLHHYQKGIVGMPFIARVERGPSEAARSARTKGIPTSPLLNPILTPPSSRRTRIRPGG